MQTTKALKIVAMLPLVIMILPLAFSGILLLLVTWLEKHPAQPSAQK